MADEDHPALSGADKGGDQMSSVGRRHVLDLAAGAGQPGREQLGAGVDALGVPGGPSILQSSVSLARNMDVRSSSSRSVPGSKVSPFYPSTSFVVRGA
ncbi:MAG: hypothetical protein U0R26_10935 [Solirubrobacterales bacterium]